MLSPSRLVASVVAGALSADAFLVPAMPTARSLPRHRPATLLPFTMCACGARWQPLPFQWACPRLEAGGALRPVTGQAG